MTHRVVAVRSTWSIDVMEASQLPKLIVPVRVRYDPPVPDLPGSASGHPGAIPGGTTHGAWGRADTSFYLQRCVRATGTDGSGPQQRCSRQTTVGSLLEEVTKIARNQVLMVTKLP